MRKHQPIILTESLVRRFWAHVVKHPTECWGWVGGHYTFGYGAIRAGARGSALLAAHRVSYVIHHGPIPDGHLVLHECHNPPCTRPDHIYAGTYDENNGDTVRHGNHVSQTKPERLNGGGRLNAENAREIYDLAAQGFAQTDLARRFGVSKSLVNMIVSGKRWGGVTSRGLFAPRSP